MSFKIKWLRLAAFLGLLVFFPFCALGEVTATLSVEDWTSEPGGSIAILGTIDGLTEDQENAIWHLDLQTSYSQDAGNLVFTTINEKNVKIRNRSDTLTADILGNVPNTFAAEWYLSDTVVDTASSVLRFTLTGADGKVLASAELRGNQSALSAVDPVSRAMFFIRRWKWVLWATVAAFWGLALLGTFLFRKKRV